MEIKLLGFIISTVGICIDPDNGVLTLPLQQSSKELQHYLGLFNYFCKHLSMYL